MSEYKTVRWIERDQEMNMPDFGSTWHVTDWPGISEDMLDELALAVAEHNLDLYVMETQDDSYVWCIAKKGKRSKYIIPE